MSKKKRFWQCCREGDLKSMIQMLDTTECRKLLCSKDECGWTCLQRSIVEHRYAATRLLIDRSHLDDLEQRGPASQTALIVAAQWGNLKALKHLICRGARIDSRDEEGMTSLMWGSKEGHWNVVKELLVNKADVFMEDKCNRSAHDWFVRGSLRRESCCPGCGRAGDPDLTSTIRSMLSTTRDKAADKGKKKKRKRKKRKESPVASEEQRRNRRHNVINAAVAV